MSADAPNPKTAVEEPVRSADRQGGPLSDEIPPASTNWRSDEESTVPAQRPSVDDEAEKR